MCCPSRDVGWRRKESGLLVEEIRLLSSIEPVADPCLDHWLQVIWAFGELREYVMAGLSDVWHRLEVFDLLLGKADCETGGRADVEPMDPGAKGQIRSKRNAGLGQCVSTHSWSSFIMQAPLTWPLNGPRYAFGPKASVEAPR